MRKMIPWLLGCLILGQIASIVLGLALGAPYKTLSDIITGGFYLALAPALLVLVLGSLLALNDKLYPERKKAKFNPIIYGVGIALLAGGLAFVWPPLALLTVVACIVWQVHDEMKKLIKEQRNKNIEE